MRQRRTLATTAFVVVVAVVAALLCCFSTGVSAQGIPGVSSPPSPSPVQAGSPQSTPSGTPSGTSSSSASSSSSATSTVTPTAPGTQSGTPSGTSTVSLTPTNTPTPSATATGTRTPPPSAPPGFVPFRYNVADRPLSNASEPAATAQQGVPAPNSNANPGLPLSESGFPIAEPPVTLPPGLCFISSCEECVLTESCLWCRLYNRRSGQLEAAFCTPNITVSFPAFRYVFCSVGDQQFAPVQHGFAEPTLTCSNSTVPDKPLVISLALHNEPPLLRSQIIRSILVSMQIRNEERNLPIPGEGDVVITGYSGDFTATQPTLLQFYFLNIAGRSSRALTHDFRAQLEHGETVLMQVDSWNIQPQQRKQPRDTSVDLPAGAIAGICIGVALVSCLFCFALWRLFARVERRRYKTPFPTRPFTAEEQQQAIELNKAEGNDDDAASDYSAPLTARSNRSVSTVNTTRSVNTNRSAVRNPRVGV